MLQNTNWVYVWKIVKNWVEMYLAKVYVNLQLQLYLTPCYEDPKQDLVQPITFRGYMIAHRWTLIKCHVICHMI